MNTRDDLDLQQRFIAKAEMMGIPNAAQWVGSNITLLITEVVQEGQTIGDVYSYAREVRDTHIATTPPPPGKNLGAVTDAHLETAITALTPQGE